MGNQYKHLSEMFPLAQVIARLSCDSIDYNLHYVLSGVTWRRDDLHVTGFSVHLCYRYCHLSIVAQNTLSQIVVSVNLA
jgi:hypothetical protein